MGSQGDISVTFEQRKSVGMPAPMGVEVHGEGMSQDPLRSCPHYSYPVSLAAWAPLAWVPRHAAVEPCRVGFAAALASTPK
jgi:hypothetical protein